MCCDRIVNVLEKLKVGVCNKECKEAGTASDDDISWKTKCIEPAKPVKSLYAYCQDNFKESVRELNLCKLDFCHLCCVSAPNLSGKKMKDESLNSCHGKCTVRYSDPKDIVIV